LEVIGFDVAELEGVSTEDYEKLCKELNHRLDEDNKALKKKKSDV